MFAGPAEYCLVMASETLQEFLARIWVAPVEQTQRALNLLRSHLSSITTVRRGESILVRCYTRKLAKGRWRTRNRRKFHSDDRWDQNHSIRAWRQQRIVFLIADGLCQILRRLSLITAIQDVEDIVDISVTEEVDQV